VSPAISRGFSTMLSRAASIVFGCALSILASTAWAEQPDGEYLDGGSSKVGVILVHGRFGGRGDAKSPVVNPLRIAIHKHLGFHTLSITYPQSGRSRSAADEAGNFPAAYQRLDSAIAFLTKEKGVTQIYVMGHSLGTRITISYLANKSVPDLRGYIGVGIYGGGKCEEGDANPLNTLCNLKTILRNNPNFPVIDVVAMSDEKDVHFANGRTILVSPAYRQVRIEDADHLFRRKEDDMVNTVVDWLKQQQNK
jgi:pimeloyl-ACP methyl ester carboxylesterase